MIKLRNPYSEANWEGKGSAHDNEFWADALASQEKIKFLEHFDQQNG